MFLIELSSNDVYCICSIVFVFQDREERRQREELLEDYADNLAWEEAQKDVESYFINIYDVEDDDENNFDFESEVDDNETGTVVSFRLEKPHTRHSQVMTLAYSTIIYVALLDQAFH